MTHTPTIARGFSLVDSTETYWKTGYCPYRIKKNGLTGSANLVERVDQGATFYKKFFFGQGNKTFYFYTKAASLVLRFDHFFGIIKI